MMHSAWRWLALLALAALSACGDRPPAPPPDGGPALWRVRGEGLDGWLFGTIHVLPHGVEWQTGAIRDAMNQADRLELESAEIQDEGRTRALFEKMGRSAGLPPLQARVPVGDQYALERIAHEAGTSTEALSGYESWAAAMLLSAASQQALDVSRDDGVEPALIAAFRKAGKPVSGVETVARQFGAFDTLPEAAQRRLLTQTVHEAREMRALYGRVLAAWLKGDVEAIAREDQRGEQPDRDVEEAVLNARNRDWAAEIARAKGRPLIAVGTGHLTGRGNLIDLLTARGLKVTRIQ
ncbi:TraB/GumN family protein [Sphingobium bisphenolivorans]|uniref:TraB/GumN family protein n=1 Tax=Sphingobium bisphenolivorans TaxID=1335760 RepID=UPI0003B3D9D2|nr:TraB/GumN family protein [Sphingobium bisphenolivorans]